MFADEIRRAIEAASRITLPQVTAQLWRAFGDGHITEAEAERLSALIEARTLTGKPARFGQPPSPAEPQPVEAGDTPQVLPGSARRSVGSRPRTDASMERRRRWAASGRLPPGLAARFTLAEQAVLALVAAESTRRGDCRLAVGHLAAIVGVAETTVRNAIREAGKLGLVTVEERRITGFRNDTNIVRIVAPEWTAWLRLARKTHPAHLPQQVAGAEGGGCKSPKRTHTQVLNPLDSRITQPSKGCRRAAGDLDRAAPSRIRQGGGKARAMR
ncbi:helix-turn-helix domain-containing protein [Methylobacterium oryzae]|uniref:helix-turn-helix domain-containing protein n=1 Tax=Methylobacterium oryzae TaxID=334852 RepID=UPI001F183DEB|nr:helix-turn-helix domain-containing protein [Methylobacterium oryzae]UIN38443.1 helix-turn-helix domain-containing protein [Methylobacterium oryzae]